MAVAFYLFSIILFPTPTSAQFNPSINYQAKLTASSSVAVPDGLYDIKFNLYTASSSGTAIWTETRNGVTNGVPVSGGLFSVMLGEVNSLTGVDFNQTLYLGVTVGTDTEMTPRKVIGAVPAAFVAQTANSANTVGGVASSSFLRSDQADTMAATSASTLLTITQNGTGNILDLFDGATNVFTVADGGNVGIGTTNPITDLQIGEDASDIDRGIRIVSSGANVSRIDLQEDGDSGHYLEYDGSFDRLFIGSRVTGVDRTGPIMSFERSGDVGIGYLNPLEKFHVNGNIRIGDTSSLVGCVRDDDGSVIAGTCSSDKILKTDIISLSSSSPKSYLAAMTALEPVAYYWNDLASSTFNFGTEDIQVGFIAQQVQETMPELVMDGQDGFLHIRFTEMNFYILQALREMWTEVQKYFVRTEALEQEVEVLENEVKTLKTRLEILESGSAAATVEYTSDDTGTSDASAKDNVGEVSVAGENEPNKSILKTESAVNESDLVHELESASEDKDLQVAAEDANSINSAVVEETVVDDSTVTIEKEEVEADEVVASVAEENETITSE